MAAKRRSSQAFDETESFRGALYYQLDEKVYVHPKLKRFIDLKSRQHGVEPRMFLPSMLGSTANAMGMSEVRSCCLSINLI